MKGKADVEEKNFYVNCKTSWKSEFVETHTQTSFSIAYTCHGLSAWY